MFYFRSPLRLESSNSKHFRRDSDTFSSPETAIGTRESLWIENRRHSDTFSTYVNESIKMTIRFCDGIRLESQKKTFYIRLTFR